MHHAESPGHAEWQALYVSLLAVLMRHGVHDPFGDGDFFLIDDDYGSAQHKIECASESAFTPALVEEIQKLLEPLERPWEVIVALPATRGNEHGFAISKRACIEHLG